MSTPARDTNQASVTLKALAGPAGGALSLLARTRTVVAQRFRQMLAPAPTPAREFSAGHTTAGSWVGRALLFSFIAMVMAPTLTASLYYGFLASNEYVSETRLTVRAASEDKQSGPDSLAVFSKLGLGGNKATVQDSYLVLNYLKSRSVVEDIGGDEYMEQKFSHSGIDWFSRLPRGRPIEEVWKYWTYHVSPVIDALSGIVTVKVYAFSPEDAQEIAIKILDLSERLVNRVSERSRAAAVKEAEAEVERAEHELVATRSDLQSFRNQSLTIDPVAKAASIGEMMGKLLVQRSEIENQILTFSGALSANSPTVRNQKNQLDAVDRQIAELKKQLTSTGENDRPVATELSTFEQLKLKEQFSEKKYTTAELSLDRAKLDLEKTKLFISLVVEPGLPQYPLFPERGIDILLVFAVGFVSWGILSLISASVLDHLI